MWKMTWQALSFRHYAAAVVAMATVLWTVRTPEHDGVVIVAFTDVPPLVWVGTILVELG